MSVTLRDAEPAELEAIGHLLVAAYTEYVPTGEVDPATRAAFDAYLEEVGDVASRVPVSEQVVADLDGKLVGAVTYYRPGKLAYEGGEVDTPPGWAGIRLLGVHPESRGHGVGRLLTDECIRRARAHGATSVALHTTDLMVIARGMYERMGFQREPAHDFYPIEGSDFCVVAYRLPL